MSVGLFNHQISVAYLTTGIPNSFLKFCLYLLIAFCVFCLPVSKVTNSPVLDLVRSFPKYLNFFLCSRSPVYQTTLPHQQILGILFQKFEF
jgi:hypothetical protein